MFLSKTSLLLATLVNLVAAGPAKYNSAGYSAWYSAGFDTPSGCTNLYGGGYVDVSVYGSQTKFQATGKDGYKETFGYESLSAYFDVVTKCNGDTVETLSGYAWQDVYDTPPVFGIEGKKLNGARINDLIIPAWRYTCTWVCTEYCWAEIFGYGTCPPEEPYLECYYGDCVQEEAGNVELDIAWTPIAASGQSSGTYRYRDPRTGYTYFTKSRGTYRETSGTLTATLEGNSFLPSQPAYSYGQIGSTTYMEIYKSK